MSLSEVARRLYAVLSPHGVIIGGICAMMHGVERFTRDVDLASDLSPEAVLDLLRREGIEAEVHRGEAFETLPWVIRGECEGIPFQVLPADTIGVRPAHAVVHVELGIASEEDFITSKCIAGGQQDLSDVAVLTMRNRELLPFALSTADAHGCRDKLDAWLQDERLLARYGTKPANP